MCGGFGFNSVVICLNLVRLPVPLLLSQQVSSGLIHVILDYKTPLLVMRCLFLAVIPYKKCNRCKYMTVLRAGGKKGL